MQIKCCIEQHASLKHRRGEKRERVGRVRGEREGGEGELREREEREIVRRER